MLQGVKQALAAPVLTSPEPHLRPNEQISKTRLQSCQQKLWKVEQIFSSRWWAGQLLLPEHPSAILTTSECFLLETLQERVKY